MVGASPAKTTQRLSVFHMSSRLKDLRRTMRRSSFPRGSGALLVLIFSRVVSPTYLLGEQGENCDATCTRQGLVCLTDLTGVTLDTFGDLGVGGCLSNDEFCRHGTYQVGQWWAHDQPCYVSGSTDPKYNCCLGYLHVPDQVHCSIQHPQTRRVCNCQPPPPPPPPPPPKPPSAPAPPNTPPCCVGALDRAYTTTATPGTSTST